MKKSVFLLILLNVLLLHASGQVQPYGTIDTADLKMTSCDFEKDANAEVLFDRAEVVTGIISTTIIRHKRIKIFNASGANKADISLSYFTRDGLEDISDVMGETINLENNAIVFTKIESKLIYKQTIDKNYKRFLFTFPNVKAGSVIEYTYKTTINSQGSFPDWAFQEDMPIRYSELKASISNDYYYKMTPRVKQDYEKNTVELWMKGGEVIGKKYIWALSNVNSFKEEPYSTSDEDNLEGMDFFLSGIAHVANGSLRSIEKSWLQIAAAYIHDGDFGIHLNEKLSDEQLLAKVKLLNSDDDKIRYLFNEIKNNVKWNGENEPYVNKGLKEVWAEKLGNSTEINLVLYRFLKQAGIECFPVLTRTRELGKLNTEHPDVRQFNKTVVSISTSPNKKYILDLSDKNNIYTNIPFDILNTNGLFIDPVTVANSEIIFLENEKQSKEEVSINAEINAAGQLEGVAQVNSFGYMKTDKQNLFEKLGEAEYDDRLKYKDNRIKINSLHRESVAADTLPLIEKIDFKIDLAGSGENYIYFNTNLFTTFYVNPFLSETRISPIDFGYLKYYSITGSYRTPDNYKIEAIPKSVSIQMPDTSIRFKRIVKEQNGEVIVNYAIDYKKAIFDAAEYPGIRDFYKKMFELLNEQIVLKKSG